MNIEHEMDLFIDHYPLTPTGKQLLKRKLRGLMFNTLSMGHSLYDIPKSVVQAAIDDIAKEKPWVLL